MKQIITRNFSNLGFGSSIIIMLIVIVFAASNLRALIESNSQVGHTLTVLRTLDQTLALLTGAEAGQRGFIITGEEKFLESYDAAVSPNNGILHYLQELRQLTSDNPNQGQRLDLLDSLVMEKLAFMRETIDLRRNAGFDAAQNAVLTDEGRQLMEDIRQLLANIQNEEEELLQQRSNAASASLQYTLFTLITGAGLSLSLLSLSYYMVNREVNVRRRAEEALQQLNRELDQRVAKRTAELAASERHFRDLADNALIGIYRSTLKGELLYVNETLVRMMGFDTPDSMIQSGAVARWRDPSSRQAFIEQLQRAGIVENFENVVLKANGEPMPILISARLLGDQLTGTVLDITERKEAEEALRASEERYRSTLDNMMEGVQIIGFDWRYLYVNNVAAIHGQKAKEELLGHTMMEMYPGIETSALFALLQRCLKETTAHHMENEFTYPDGKQGWFDLNIQPVPEGLLILSQDITARKRAEEDRLARETAERASQAKSEFLSRMSHELRTPMNSILGFAQLLKMDELTPDQMNSLEQILKSGRHLLDLINEVLDIARIEAGRMTISPEPVHLDEALKSATDLIRPMADQRGISIHVRIPSSRDVFVTADRQRLKQVLLNLLSNAVKYNREGGQIYVTASLLMDGYLHLAVRDTGKGIPPEKMERLFIPFERLELDTEMIQGTGLGLALSKGLVEAMGGRMGAQSVVGEGSTFWFDLKLTTQQKEAIVMAEVDDFLKETPDSKKGLVLYVEDNLSNIQLIEKIFARLSADNVKLITAMQGRLAMDLAREHRPALILLDLHLPDMHGSAVLESLRAEPETRDIPIVVMSADATPNQIEKMLAAGARAYLTKPIDVKEFLKVIGEILGS